MPSILPYEPYTGEDQPLPVVPNMGQILAAQPQQPAPQEQPGFFSNLMGKLQNDPAANMALMMAGARMLQGRAPGQSLGGGLADSIMMGAMAHEGVLENQRAQEKAQQEMAMKQAESTSLVESRQATTESTKQTTKFNAEKQPVEMDKLRNQAKEAGLKLKIAEVEQIFKDAELRKDPTGQLHAKNALDKLTAELERTKALTAQASSGATANSAQARLYGAQADQADQMAKWQKTLTDPNATEDEKAQAERNIQLFKRSQGGGSSAQVMNRADLARQYSITLGLPVGSKEVTEAVLNHEKTKQKADLEEQYAKYLETQTATSPAQEEAAWKRWVAMKRRFGVDVESVMGTKAGKDAKSGGGTVEMVLDPKTGKYVIKQ